MNITLSCVLLISLLACTTLAAKTKGVTYEVDPVKGDDTNPAGKPWRTFAKLNTARLAPGDTVVIAPGRQEESLAPMGEGTRQKPIVIRFLPGVHTIGVKGAIRLPMFVSNACDFSAPKPVGVLWQNVKHLRLEGGGVEGSRKTTLLYDGRMVQFSNCKGDSLVDSCHLSGMQDDAINCHGTHLRIIEKRGGNQVLMRFMHSQTYGFAAFEPGDEVAVICHSNLREYSNNPRRKVENNDRKDPL